MSTQELYLKRAENFRARALWADTAVARARLIEQASYWQRLADWERAVAEAGGVQPIPA
jgi:hypothetical protein